MFPSLSYTLKNAVNRTMRYYVFQTQLFTKHPCVPGALLSPSYVLSYLILAKTLKSRCNYRFTAEEMEARVFKQSIFTQLTTDRAMIKSLVIGTFHSTTINQRQQSASEQFVKLMQFQPKAKNLTFQLEKLSG